MQDENLMPVEKYAALKQSSVYQVLKKIKSGELKAVVEEAEGKKSTFVILDGPVDEVEQEQITEIPEPQGEMDYKTAYETLRRELVALRRDFEALKERVEMGKAVL